MPLRRFEGEKSDAFSSEIDFSSLLVSLAFSQSRSRRSCVEGVDVPLDIFTETVAYRLVGFIAGFMGSRLIFTISFSTRRPSRAFCPRLLLCGSLSLKLREIRESTDALLASSLSLRSTLDDPRNRERTYDNRHPQPPSSSIPRPLSAKNVETS